MIRTSAKNKSQAQIDSNKLKYLGESIILQSIEDLWHPQHSKESMQFFRGAGFGSCADIAGMGQESREGIINLLERAGFSVTAEN